MGNSTTMTYGNYNFTPVPFLDITKSYQTTADGTRIGTLTRATLNGTLTPILTGVNIAYDDIDLYQDLLRAALATDGQQFLVKCDNNTLIEVYPRVIADLNFPPSNNNWVHTSPFSVTLEWDDEPVGITGSGEDPTLMPPYVESATENWEVEFDDAQNKFSWTHNTGGTTDEGPTVLRLTHTLSAKGKRHYTSGGLDKLAWEQARDWVITRLGYDNTCVQGSGVFNLNPANFTQLNHVRSKQLSETDGTFNVTESWLVIESGVGNLLATGDRMALEDYNTSLTTSLEGNTTVNIQGTIQGLESRIYGSTTGDYSVQRNKFDNALSYWVAVSGRLYNRASTAAQDFVPDVVNVLPLSRVIGYNPKAGTINYAFDYDDRPCNFIAGSRSEQISITDNSPVDVFASLTVLGRARGPVMQAINTVTSFTKTVNINVVMATPTGCTSGNLPATLALAPTSAVNSLLCTFQTEITNVYDKVFKTQDSATWNIKNGNYSRVVAWEYTSCTGTTPSTSFC